MTRPPGAARAGLADAQRAVLADALAASGPDAPTLDEGWTTADLAAHVVLRDRRPDTAPGAALPVPALQAWTERARLRRRDGTSYADLVDLVRRGPLLARVPVLDDLVNLAEMYLHAEDVLRCRPGWQPRELPAEVDRALFRSVKPLSALQRRPGRRVLTAPDGRTATVGSGEPSASVHGPAQELLLWASGRTGAARVEVS